VHRSAVDLDVDRVVGDAGQPAAVVNELPGTNVTEICP
jgi:hypothetical protein